MAQITIYLEPEIASKARREAKAKNTSLSKWISELIRECTADAWPESVKQLAGAWSDFPTTTEIRKDLGNDVPREDL